MRFKEQSRFIVLRSNTEYNHVDGRSTIKASDVTHLPLKRRKGWDKLMNKIEDSSRSHWNSNETSAPFMADTLCILTHAHEPGRLANIIIKRFFAFFTEIFFPLTGITVYLCVRSRFTFLRQFAVGSLQNEASAEEINLFALEDANLL